MARRPRPSRTANPRTDPPPRHRSAVGCSPPNPPPRRSILTPTQVGDGLGGVMQRTQPFSVSTMHKHMYNRLSRGSPVSPAPSGTDRILRSNDISLLGKRFRHHGATLRSEDASARDVGSLIKAEASDTSFFGRRRAPDPGTSRWLRGRGMRPPTRRSLDSAIINVGEVGKRSSLLRSNHKRDNG